MRELFGKFKKLNKEERISFYITSGIFIYFILFTYFHTPPKNFPLNEVISIEDGESLQNITNKLYENKIIKFPLIFRSTVIILGGERKVIAGDYLLDEKVGPIDIAYRLIRGDFHTESKKITILEGWTNKEIAEYLEKTLIDFDKKEFLKLTKDKEGYLFPDTYFISNTTRPRTIVKLMTDNFDSKISRISGIATTTKKFDDLIIMASIIEGEANTTESRKIVSGILWKRLKNNLPLQVDATFKYIIGKGSLELTYNDLKIDSPYNTYTNKGLPPTPINNPSLDSIIAALYPKETKYFYFLTGKDGKMYYAKTFAEHKNNKALYLW